MEIARFHLAHLTPYGFLPLYRIEHGLKSTPVQALLSMVLVGTSVTSTIGHLSGARALLSKDRSCSAAGEGDRVESILRRGTLLGTASGPLDALQFHESFSRTSLNCGLPIPNVWTVSGFGGALLRSTVFGLRECLLGSRVYSA